ncbi:MAG: OmpH family outer membrane protein, partial [Cyclobacteriaceae bacterium]|nr:OmpH family outer membrane protein [Cyclobacteriaceae bacterium]
MKSKIYVLMVAICCIGLVNGVQAQLKIAYADVDYVFSKLPDAKQIESSLKAHSAQLENTLKTKY